MLAFVVLAMPLLEHGPALQRVAWADVIGSAMLIVGYWAGKRSESHGCRRMDQPARLPSAP